MPEAVTRDHEAVLAQLRQFDFQAPAARPHVLLSVDELATIKAQAEADPALMRRIRQRAEHEMQVAGEAIDFSQPYISIWKMDAVALWGALTADQQAIDWINDRNDVLMSLDTWFARVHLGGSLRVYDHVIANLAAQVAAMHDLAAVHYGEGRTDAVYEALRTKCYELFIDGVTNEPVEWWWPKSCASNWKIMTCGDTGTAMCAFAHRWPDGNRGLELAAKGVLELLDEVPPEGDWDEGVGYWFNTLWMGLRFARTLRRITGGAVNLFEHPACQVTGDFCTLLTTPRGDIYNFNDANAPMEDRISETLIMLAKEQQRGDWMKSARQHRVPSLLYLPCDDPQIASAEPATRVAQFPHTGVAGMRSGWGDKATFVGFKSARSRVGHSHLDANSFVVEARGVPLLTEYPYWPQAHFLGFHDPYGPRWNFDANATIGHTTLMVDNKGQQWGPHCVGQILRAEDRGDHTIVAGQAAACYPDTLDHFVRTLLLVGDDTLVVRDVIKTKGGPRHVEWLAQYAGTITSDGVASVIENQGVQLRVTPLLPDREERNKGWRISDVERVSSYEGSDSQCVEARSIRYRSFSPFAVVDSYEFLFLLQIDPQGPAHDWQFETSESGWTLRLGNHRQVITPDGDELACTAGN